MNILCVFCLKGFRKANNKDISSVCSFEATNIINLSCKWGSPTDFAFERFFFKLSFSNLCKIKHFLATILLMILADWLIDFFFLIVVIVVFCYYYYYYLQNSMNIFCKICFAHEKFAAIFIVHKTETHENQW